MRKSFLCAVFSAVISLIFLNFTQALAAPTLYQCTLPSATVGPLEPKAPAPLPKSGELLIKFQRPMGESTQSAINLAELKNHDQLLDRIVKIINDETAQRLPKMAALRERGMDDIKSLTLGNTRFLLINELLRILMVYDPAEIQTIFDSSASGGYTAPLYGTRPDARGAELY